MPIDIAALALEQQSISVIQEFILTQILEPAYQALDMQDLLMAMELWTVMVTVLTWHQVRQELNTVLQRMQN